MKKSADDDTLELVSWPFLLPLDFVPCLNFVWGSVLYYFKSFPWFILFLKHVSNIHGIVLDTALCMRILG